RITTASALVTYDVSEKHSRALWLGAGPGYIRHAGQAFGDSGNPTSIAAVFGLGSTIPLGSAIRVELGASAFLYEYGGMFGLVGGPPSLNATGQFERRFQHDGVLHVGVAWNGR
ncbi:MAG: hypothetical protein ABI442_08360, partial [Gemmatimonadaceae bacterium]